MLEKNITKIKTTNSNPFFTSDKWNLSVDYLKVLENIFSSINKKFLGIFNEEILYNYGDYIFFDKKCYEITNDPVEHFESFTPANFIRLNSDKKLEKSGEILDEKIFDFIKKNKTNDEHLCISNKLAYLLDEQLTDIPLLNDKKITSADFDEYAFYFTTSREIIKKERKNATGQQLIFNNNLLIKNICVNDLYLFVLLSDGSIKKIDRSNDQVVDTFQTNIIFSNDVKMLSTYPNHLFVVDNAKFYSFHIENTIKKISEFTHSLIKNKAVSFSRYDMFLTVEFSDGSVINTKPSLTAMKEADFSKIIINNVIVTNKDVKHYIKPSENLIDNDNIVVFDKTKINHIKNKGLEINTDKFTYSINGEIKNQTIMFVTSNNTDNEIISIRTAINKLLNFEIDKIGFKKVFIDIIGEKCDISVYHEDKVYRETKNLINSTAVFQNLDLSAKTGTFLLQEFYIFNKILTNSEKDFYLSNKIKNDFSNNKTEFLPHAPVSCDSVGVPKLKLANQSLISDSTGLYVNLSNEYKNAVVKLDKTISFSKEGAKQLYSEFKQNLLSETAKKSNLVHRHDWSDLNDVPISTTSNKGIVQLVVDANDDSSDKSATPAMVKQVQGLIIKNIEDNIVTKINVLNEGLDGLRNVVIPQIQNSLNTNVGDIINKINDIDRTMGLPNTYLDKTVGGEILGDIKVKNIHISAGGIQMKKENDNPLILTFGNGFIKHEKSETGIDTFRIAASTYVNDNSGGLDIGHIKNNSFYRTAFISSSGVGTFYFINSSTDVIVGRDVKVKGDVYLTSDRRLKREIKIVDDSLNRIDKISGYTFYKEGFKNKTAGIIAQEVREVFPELIQEVKGTLEVNYNGLHALEIEAIKELKKENENLKKELNVIKEKLNSLKI